MRLSSTLRTAFLALAVMAAATAGASAATGSISFKIVKGGFFIGGAGGSGTLTLDGTQHAISIGGISAGLVFGAAEISFVGTAYHLNSVHDIEGPYVAAGAGASATHGKGVIVLTNPKGVELDLSGHQNGPLINVDLSGMAITLK